MTNIHLTNIMRNPLPTRSNKGGKGLNTKPTQKKKKMEPRKKDQFAILKQYNDPLYKLNIDRWLKMGAKPQRRIAEWLEKGGYLNLKASAKVHYEQHAKRYPTDLRYNDSLLTNKGFDYYDELEKLDQESAIILWAIVSIVAALVSGLFAALTWFGR